MSIVGLCGFFASPTNAVPDESSNPTACPASLTPDIYLVGTGHCTDAHGLTPFSSICVPNATLHTQCPPMNLTYCGHLCNVTWGCTGFQTNGMAFGNDGDGSRAHAATECSLFVPAPPAPGPLPYNASWVAVNGTQTLSQWNVVKAHGGKECCYKVCAQSFHVLLDLSPLCALPCASA